MRQWKQRWHHAPKGARIIGMVVIGLVTAAVLGLVFGIFVRELWNWLMPELFGLKTITYWQAFGIVLLGHLIFGGSGSGSHESGARHKKHWGRRHVTIHEEEDMNKGWEHWKYYDEWWNSQGKDAFKEYAGEKGPGKIPGSAENE